MVQRRPGRPSPWQVQIRDSAGKKILRSFTLKSDAEEFERAEKRKRQLVRAGMEAPKDQILFLDYSKTFLARRFGGAVAIPTAVQDESRLRNYWLEKFGPRPMLTITSHEIKAHLDYIQFELKHTPADRNRHRALMHTIFQEALSDDKVLFNPVSRVPLIEENQRRRSSGTLEPKDQDSYIDAMYARSPRYGMLADLMLWTGARIMSAAAIQYRDIDFESGEVRICRLIERASRKVVDRTKGAGEGGQELVPLFPRLKDRILAHRKGSAFIRPTDFIATAKDGGYVGYESYLDTHNLVLEEIKLPRFTPHALRKAFATNAKRAGYTQSEIREMLGHSSDAVTQKYDLKDIGHLKEKGHRLGFGGSQGIHLATKGLKKTGPKRGRS